MLQHSCMYPIEMLSFIHTTSVFCYIYTLTFSSFPPLLPPSLPTLSISTVTSIRSGLCLLSYWSLQGLLPSWCVGPAGGGERYQAVWGHHSVPILVQGIPGQEVSVGGVWWGEGSALKEGSTEGNVEVNPLGVMWIPWESCTGEMRAKGQEEGTSVKGGG